MGTNVPTDPKDRLIVALDVPTRGDALKLVDELDGLVSFFKVGYQLFLAEGMAFVKELAQRRNRIFLDLKMDDVDETITLAVREISKSDVTFVTIHGNGATARAAQAGRNGSGVPKILSLTLLSSLDEGDLKDLQILGKKGRFQSLTDYAKWRAEEAIKAGVDGLIASGETVRPIRDLVPSSTIIVTPGIRASGVASDDHKRSLSPTAAIRAGADYLVVGRPIRNATNRADAARAIIEEIKGASGA